MSRIIAKFICGLNSEQLFKFVFVQFTAYNAQSARIRGRTRANVDFAGNVVEVQPLAAIACNYALCAEHSAEAYGVRKRFKRVFKLILCKLFACFNAPA